MTLLPFALFLALAGLVGAGATNPLDQFGIDHLTPGLDPTSHYHLTLASLLVPWRGGDPNWQNAVNLWLYPASVPVSALLVAAACWLLHRRGRTRAALLWAGAWVMGAAVEGIGKILIRRPDLHAAVHGARVPFDSYASSFPSGHTIRSLVVAGAVVFVWRRARWAAAAWAATVLPLLVAAGDHTITDVLGGALVAWLLLVPLSARRP